MGRIASPVTYRKEEDLEMNFYLKPTEQIDNNRVLIQIEHNYFNSPILLETIKDDEVFKDFKGGNQGTNFTATKEQYETFIDLASSNNVGAYEEVKKVLDQEKLKTFLSILRAFVKFNTIHSNDERISFNVRENKKRLVFIIGNRYALCIQKRNNKTEMSFISKDILSGTSENFRNPNGKIEAYLNTFENLKGFEKNINEGFLIELDRNNKCPHRKYINQDFINDIYSNQTTTIKFIVANITWNSKEWKEVSEDASGHAWVGGENIPHESWNFDFDNPRNKNGNVLGFAKFTNAPKVEGDKNLIIFYSQGKIVGFYGKAEILKKWVDISDKESYNLIGDKNLSVVLKNKIDNIKEKGYLEDKERVGQVGFSYLKKTETALNLLDEAIKLNPAQHQVLTNIKQWILKSSNSQSNSNNGTMESFNKTTALNQILYGPPGTGKTFNTINEALKIVDPIYFATHQNDRKKLTDRFKELLIKNSEENKGQIAFCTFHQSFSYEDFVEGIKPIPSENKTVYYDIEDGVFKNICKLADSYNSTIKVKTEGKISWTEQEFNKASFYKLSLGNYQDPSDRHIYEYCRDNNYIAIGFGQENDFSGLSESEIIEKCEDLKLEVTAAQQMNYFIHYLKKNNYVIISNGNKYVRAIGKVIGDYEFVAESPIRYNHFRKVEWIFTDELIPIEEIYERGLSQKTMYKIDETALKQDFFTNNGQKAFIDEPVKEEKNYVLIIDEINRGNVSSIFGELITLTEKDKRAGCDEELEVTLPYSKKPFKVPSNVYLIGTMNTADRSIEALDTALRRRFSFKEFPPKPEIIKTEGASSTVKGMVDDIDLETLLKTINTRIEKLIDKDHRIGHSYFLKVDNKEKLVHAFKNEIIPLLEEYFFGDYGKIGLVLGSSFVEKVDFNIDFAKFEHYDTDIQSDLKEKAVFRIKIEEQWDFRAI